MANNAGGQSMDMDTDEKSYNADAKNLMDFFDPSKDTTTATTPPNLLAEPSQQEQPSDLIPPNQLGSNQKPSVIMTHEKSQHQQPQHQQPQQPYAQVQQQLQQSQQPQIPVQQQFLTKVQQPLQQSQPPHQQSQPPQQQSQPPQQQSLPPQQQSQPPQQQSQPSQRHAPQSWQHHQQNLLQQDLPKKTLQQPIPTGSRNILFVGNPGVGKSTLLNVVMKSQNQSGEESFFKSGVSIGSGLTHKLDQRIVGGINYMDTPGLQDVEMRQRAAAAITSALRIGGRYQIVFVITIESGRVRPADIACMQMVLDSAGDQINYYGVIINKLTKPVYKRLNVEGEEQERLISQIQLKNEKPRIMTPLLLAKRDVLEDENDVVIEIPELIEFMQELLPVQVDPSKVSDIPDDDTFEKMTEELEKELKELKESNEKMQEKMDADKKKYHEDIEKAMKEEQKQYDEQMARLQREAEERAHQMEEKKRQFEQERKNAEEMASLKMNLSVNFQEMQLKHQMEMEEMKQKVANTNYQMAVMKQENEQKIALLARKRENGMKKMFKKATKSIVNFFSSLPKAMGLPDDDDVYSRHSQAHRSYGASHQYGGHGSSSYEGGSYGSPCPGSHGGGSYRTSRGSPYDKGARR